MWSVPEDLDNHSMRLFSYFWKNTSYDLHMWRQYWHWLEYMPPLVYIAPQYCHRHGARFLLLKVSSCTSTSGVCQDSFRKYCIWNSKWDIPQIPRKWLIFVGIPNSASSSQTNGRFGEPHHLPLARDDWKVGNSQNLVSRCWHRTMWQCVVFCLEKFLEKGLGSREFVKTMEVSIPNLWPWKKRSKSH